MAQYIIYYLDRSFTVTDEQVKNSSDNISFKLPEDISKILIEFEHNDKIKHSVFLTDKVEETFSIFSQQYKIIEAAGGIVKNPSGEILAIFRLGKWDLPKGKIEINEKPEEAAEREIAEECGISGHSLKAKICETYHTYKIGDKKILKKTHWYAFTVENIPNLTPQTIENIEEAKWVSKVEFDKLLEHSYPSIRQVFKTALEMNDFL